MRCRFAEITTIIPGVPFKRYAIRLPPNASGLQVYKQYERLLLTMRGVDDDRSDAVDMSKLGYNLVIVVEWIVLIPRRAKEVERLMMGNAAIMVGLAWSCTDELRKRLVGIGKDFLKALTIMGAPLGPAGPAPSPAQIS